MLFSRAVFTLLSCGTAVSALGDLTTQSPLEGPERRQCAELIKLEGILDWMNDPEQLAEFESRHNLTQAEIDDIKAKSMREQERLMALQSNTTLMQECATLRAAKQLRADCREMRRLMEVVNLADNQTVLQEFQSKHDLPGDWLTKLTEKAANASTRLDELRKNSTLVDACDLDLDDQRQASTSQGMIAEAKSATMEPISAAGAILFAAAITAAFFAST